MAPHFISDSKDPEDSTDQSTNEDRNHETLDEDASYPGDSDTFSVSRSHVNTDRDHATGSGNSTVTSGSVDGLDGKIDVTVICWSRWFFIIVLFSCTVVLCGYTYATLREGETREFEENVRRGPTVLSCVERILLPHITLLLVNSVRSGFSRNHHPHYQEH
jgi:hypothetical protein